MRHRRHRRSIPTPPPARAVARTRTADAPPSFGRWLYGQRWLLAALLGAWLMLLAVAARAADDGPQQLIVFVQPGNPVDDDYVATKHAAVVEMAEELGITVTVKDARQGAPAEVTITPLLVFQNHRGRSIYQGRTTTPDRVRNFLRTSRFVPQDGTPMARQKVPVMAMGRQQVWSPLKIADVTGSPPKGYKREVFVREAMEGLKAGFTNYRVVDEASVRRADRGFYMDFYPWRAADGTLFLSLALYSEFHCKHPVYEKKKEPLVGPWTDREKLYAQAAKLMEAAVLEQIASTTGGDGFTPVPSKTPMTSWEALGFTLPPKPVGHVPSDVNVTMVQDWIVAPAAKDQPAPVLFHFPAPLDNFAGEATGSSGYLKLGEGLSMADAKGRFIVDMSSVTMGEPDLDDALQGSMFLHTKQYPRASFVIKSTGFEDGKVAFGGMALGTLSGDFTFKDKTVALTAPVEVEPVLDADNKLTLLLRGTFQMDLMTWGLNPGLDGPDEAKTTLVFDLNFRLTPKP